MRLSIANMLKRLETLDDLIEQKEKSIAESPSGTLRISSSHGKPQYYYRPPGMKTKPKYICPKDIEIARQVAQREYDERVLRTAKAERDSLKKIIARYEKGVAEDIYEKLTPGRQELVRAFRMGDEEYAKRWKEKPYDKPGFAEGYPEYYSNKGLRVRSKSEAAIANRYDERNIPFRYEEPLFLDGWGWVEPDFKLLNIRYRKEFLHEHLGKMDDPEYAEKNIGKIKAYIKNGYFPGKNLILTFEVRKYPLIMREIDAVIDKYLI